MASKFKDVKCMDDVKADKSYAAVTKLMLDNHQVDQISLIISQNFENFKSTLDLFLYQMNITLEGNELSPVRLKLVAEND